MAESVQKGDMVKVSYTGRSLANGKVFDTTSEEVAKKEDLYKEGFPFKPVLVVVGEGQLLKGLDEALAGAEVGAQAKVRVPKEKAFGDRRPELERVIALKEFEARGIRPEVGQVLDVDGAPGKIASVGGGRVRIDFNPELAGQDLEYDFKVEARFADAAGQVEALRQEFMPQCSASMADGVVKLAAPTEAAKGETYIRAKLRFLYFALRFVKGAREVVFEERYQAPKAAGAEGRVNV